MVMKMKDFVEINISENDAEIENVFDKLRANIPVVVDPAKKAIYSLLRARFEKLSDDAFITTLREAINYFNDNEKVIAIHGISYYLRCNCVETIRDLKKLLV